MTEKKEKTPTMAAALQYNSETDRAPRLIAYGEGGVAEAILKVAKENEIPLYQDQALIQLLANIDVGEEIPEEAYHIVAEVLAWVYRLAKQNQY